MSEIAPSTIHNGSLGSLKLIIVSLTIGSSGDTYTIEPYAPVVDYWVQSHIGTAGYSGDVKWTASTGVFAITNAQQGLTSLFILMKT